MRPGSGSGRPEGGAAAASAVETAEAATGRAELGGAIAEVAGGSVEGCGSRQDARDPAKKSEATAAASGRRRSDTWGRLADLSGGGSAEAAGAGRQSALRRADRVGCRPPWHATASFIAWSGLRRRRSSRRTWSSWDRSFSSFPAASAATRSSSRPRRSVSSRSASRRFRCYLESVQLLQWHLDARGDMGCRRRKHRERHAPRGDGELRVLIEGPESRLRANRPYFAEHCSGGCSASGSAYESSLASSFPSRPGL